MTHTRPILVALPLDHETSDIVATAAALGHRLQAPVVVVHALPHRRLESERGMDERIAEARRALAPHLRGLGSVEIQDVFVAVGDAPEVVLAAALRLAATLIITGGGRPGTVRRWVLGSVAEAIVRGSSVPVWVARGGPPAGRPVLCPVDLSSASRLGLDAAVRMARLLELPLALITVVSDDATQPQLDPDQLAVREQLEALLADYELDGVEVSVTVTRGEPAEQIVDAADEAGLLVVASRGYDPLVREWLGPVTARALRHSRCSALTIRELGEGHERRARSLARLADLYQRARQLLADGRGDEALPMLESLAEQASANAAIQDALAIALEAVGRSAEATSRRELAELIRERVG